MATRHISAGSGYPPVTHHLQAWARRSGSSVPTTFPAPTEVPLDFPAARNVTFGSDVPDGYLALSPAIGGPTGFSADALAALDEPVLMASGVGDEGAYTTPEERDDAFVGMPETGRGALLWIDDPAAVHATFALGTPNHAATARMTANVVAWLDASLVDDPDAAAWLASDDLARVSARAAEIRRR